ncbi:PP2C family serine/threonine-protein phosphatase [Bartonella sp. HY038]|uniref:PP2C family serine/threonine-protein phosphatase n=1 Tax=Bartonella sp. HY038 TaxID=2759660 RepID=UPI0015F7E74C|nr:PP2C family serine/threonine-protein phosphatase [Bartonella sp. HY038]
MDKNDTLEIKIAKFILKEIGQAYEPDSQLDYIDNLSKALHEANDFQQLLKQIKKDIGKPHIIIDDNHILGTNIINTQISITEISSDAKQSDIDNNKIPDQQNNLDENQENNNPCLNEKTLTTDSQQSSHFFSLQKSNLSEYPQEPIISISIANAHIGKPFDVPINIIADNNDVVEIIDIIFPDDIGLVFSKENQRVKGNPSQSGSFPVRVKWKISSKFSGEKKINFIINPDPKDLWEIIEPSAEIPYRKDHIVNRDLSVMGAHIAAARRRGRSHEHAGTYCDDDFYIKSCETSGWCVLLVADGAGSAKYSREGSRIVADIVGNYLYDKLCNEVGNELSDRILQWSEDDQREVWKTINLLFSEALINALREISRVAEEVNSDTKAFATTVLVTICLRANGELFAASFWLGDGAIAAYGPRGKVRILGIPDSGEYAGQTRFLDASIIKDKNFSKRVSIGKWSDVSHLLLMTDGVSDPRFETDSGLKNVQKWDELVDDLAGPLSYEEKASSHLADWLSFFSHGNHDDRTLIVYW